jgi:hypothetical protein
VRRSIGRDSNVFAEERFLRQNIYVVNAHSCQRASSVVGRKTLTLIVSRFDDNKVVKNIQG